MLFSYSAIPQDPTYHNFADARTLFGIDHFWNVVSNLLFLIAGLFGMLKLARKQAVLLPGTVLMAWVFFIGTALVAVGSGYYHLNPNNDTLLWDRLPMTLAFTSLVAIVVAEFIQLEAGKRLFYPLLLLGIASVLYWYYTESQGRGDLRLYALVQFAAMLVVLLLLVLFKPHYSRVGCYWGMLLCYTLAKLAEQTDDVWYQWLGFSGHSAKHLLAAMAPLLFGSALSHRTPVSHPEPTQ